MTSHQPETSTFEQKIQPVPSSSSDEMALDLEINGTSHRDGTFSDGDVASSNTDSLVTKPFASPSPLNEASSTSLVVNGALNNAAFASNTSVPTNPLDESPPVYRPDALESQPTEQSTSESPQMPDTSTTTTITADQPSSLITRPEPALPDLPATHSSTDGAIIAAVEDTTIISSVPPIVEASESDIRDTIPNYPTESVAEPEQLSALDTSPHLAPEPEQSDRSPTLNLTSGADIPSTDQVDAPLDLLHISSSEHPSSSVGPAPAKDSEQGNAKPFEMTMAEDQEIDMVDAPPVSTSSKLSREREDDEDGDRSAKRTKTGVDTSTAAGTPNGIDVSSQNVGSSSRVDTESSRPEGRPFTRHVEKECIKHLKNAARTADGKHFKESVAVLWPQFADSYAARIPNPVDFSLIEQKVRSGAYPTVNELKDDLVLLRSNAIAFNGADNGIAQSAIRATQAVLEKIGAISPEPIPPPKVQKKAKAATPVGEMASRAPAAVAPRRQSRGGADPAVQTFALDPHSNTPLIRRDSTKGGDGRPKREIIPPKNKDLSYARPKSKKSAVELKWCEEVLAELRKPKHNEFAYPFLLPVDPVALGIPTYFNVIKFPMDLSTVASNLSKGTYASAKEFEKDVSQIFLNCFKFNPAGNPVHELGRKFENVWKEQLLKKSRWIDDHTPATATSVSPSPESEDEDSDNEPQQQVPVNASVTTLATKRLVEEQEKLINMMTSVDSNADLIAMQQQMVQIVKDQVEKENSAAAATAAAAAQNNKKSKKAKSAPRAAPPVQQQSKKKAAPSKKTLTSHKAGGAKKERYMGTIEKEVISAGIATLPDVVSAQVLKLIQDGQPEIDEGDDGTVELDIDAIPTHTLWKIYELIKTHTPDVERDLRRQFQERDAPRAPAKQQPKKKNKPMNKYEQDRKIEHLKNQMQTFERGNSGSQEPIPTVEDHRDESSDDESSDSEEE